MRILLIGECYSNNLGDPVLCQTVKCTIRKVYPDAEIIMFDMSGKTGYSSHYVYDPKEYSFQHKVVLKLSSYFPALFRQSRLYRDYIKNEVRYIRTLYSLNGILQWNSFDLAIFAGGSLFMDYFAGIILCMVRMLARYRTRIIFHACGMSSMDADSIILLRAALRNKYVCSISLRDSFERFNHLFKVKASITETYDTALSCGEYFCPADKKGADIGIGVMRSQKYDRHQRKILEYLIHSPLNWKVFTNGADQKYALDLLKEIGMSAEEIDNHVEPCPRSAEELVELITSFDRIISVRMHGNIVAASYGIPCFGFAWDNKVTEFFSKIGLPQNYLAINDELEMNTIFERLALDSQDIRLQARRQGIESQNALIREIRDTLSLGEK